MLGLQNAARQRIDLVLKHEDSKNAKDKTKAQSLFHSTRDGDMPAHEKTLICFCDEAVTWKVAGADTTAKILSTITCHMLLVSERQKLDMMKQTLKKGMPTPTTQLTHSALEQIPYLAAVISESLRVSNGLTTRLSRIARDGPMVYKDWVIPLDVSGGCRNFSQH